MSEALPKEAAIIEAVEQLRSRLGAHAFIVADHWEADPHAIGLASPAEPGRLVYIATLGKPPGRYDVSLELPPARGSTLPYTPAGERADLDVDGLASAVRDHLRVPASRPAG